MSSKQLLFIGQFDEEKTLNYARIIVPGFRRGGTWVKGYTKQLLKNRDMQKDAVVNTAALLGSKAGLMIGGPPGMLAGDLLGAVGARRAVRDMTALKRAALNLKTREGWNQLKPLQKMKLLHNESLRHIKEEAEKHSKDLTGDIAGFIGGNVGGNLIGIPMSGAVPGALAAKLAQRAHDKFGRKRVVRK
jgi:hypothetical protein